jgi:hypothetical protein
VAASEIRDMADRDAAENWKHLIAFRDAAARNPSLEAAYLARRSARRRSRHRRCFSITSFT